VKKAIPITKFKSGDVVQIVSLRKDDRHLHKLAAFGILPGSEVEILQVIPAYVLKIDHTQIALDYEIARNILVYKQKRQGF